jgi:hypothetical protein
VAVRTQYLRWLLWITLTACVASVAIRASYIIAGGKQQRVARLLAQDIGAHTDHIDTSWGTVGGHPEVKVYGFPDADEQTRIIEHVRMRKHDLRIMQPVTITFRAYPMRVMKPNGEEANGGAAPDSVLRTVTF